MAVIWHNRSSRELLVKKGHQVVVFDDLSTGSLVNVASLKKIKKFIFVKAVRKILR